MFLRISTLNSLMKQAYKTGLAVARTEDYLYLAGSYWEAEIKWGFIPKKTLGDLITLVGELPEVGQRYSATKEGLQMEMERNMRVNDHEFKDETLTITDVIIVGTQGVHQRLLQDESTGDIYPVNNVFVQIVDNSMIEEDKGEYSVEFPFFHRGYGVLWKNNVCKLRVHFRSDDKNSKILKELRGVDITPEVPME